MSSTDSYTSAGRDTKAHNVKKKHKRKSDKVHSKKEKKHRDKKSSRRDADIIAPVRDSNGAAETFGPALPPHLLKSTQSIQAMIGPHMPSTLIERVDRVEFSSGADVGTEHTYGPICPGQSSENTSLSAPHHELEERAVKLKLAALDGSNPSTVEPKVREEWMLELPEVGLKSGLAALSNLKRKFHSGKDKPDFSDRSVWTKAPHSDNGAVSQEPTSKTVAEAMRRNALDIYEKQRDEEQERIAKKHKKKHKRDESLVEIHQRKLRQEQRKKKKELAAAGTKPERRPFCRDVDLKLNQIDRNQTKSIVDKAKVLNTKFATGHTKYL